MGNKYEAIRKTWVERIEEQKNSGLSVAAWCKREGVKESGFYRNRRRASESWQTQVKPQLIAVPMSKSTARGEPLDGERLIVTAEARPSALEIQTPAGFVIRLSARAQLDWLPDLLAVL